MKKNLHALDILLQKVEKKIVLASLMNLSPQAIDGWFKRGQIPAERVIEVERKTGISRHILRPDLYPEIAA